MLQVSATFSQAEVAAAVAAVSKCRGKPLRWSRISVVGEGAAGKTSIIRALCSEADDDPKTTIGISQRFVDLEIAAISVEAAAGKVSIVYSHSWHCGLSTRVLYGACTPNFKLFCSGPRNPQKGPKTTKMKPGHALLPST